MDCIHITTRPHRAFEIKGAPSREAQDAETLGQQAKQLAELLRQHLPETTYRLLSEAMNRQVGKSSGRAPALQRTAQDAPPEAIQRGDAEEIDEDDAFCASGQRGPSGGRFVDWDFPYYDVGEER